MTAKTTEATRKQARPLPPGWRWVRLRDVGEFFSGGTPRKEVAQYWGGNIPFVTGADIVKQYVSEGRSWLTGEGLFSGQTHVCQPGTVLLVTRTRVGRVGIAARVMGASQDISPYVCGESLLPEYAYWYLASLSDVLQQATQGSTILGLTRDYVESLFLPLLPLTEQRAIAARIESQVAEIQRIRGAADRQLKAAQALKVACLREVFDSPEAQQWPRVRLGETGAIVSGITLGRKITGANTRPVPYLRVANVKDGYLDLSDVYEIEATEAEIEKCRLKFGDLLLTEGGDRDKLGRGTFWEEQIPECLLQNHIFRVRFDLNKVSPSFIAAQIGSPYGKAYFLAHAKQTTGIATINHQVLAGFPLMVPPFSEQQRIAARLEDQMAEIQRVCQAAERQLEAINALPGALLREVFGGFEPPSD